MSTRLRFAACQPSRAALSPSKGAATLPRPPCCDRPARYRSLRLVHHCCGAPSNESSPNDPISARNEEVLQRAHRSAAQRACSDAALQSCLLPPLPMTLLCLQKRPACNNTFSNCSPHPHAPFLVDIVLHIPACQQQNTKCNVILLKRALPCGPRQQFEALGCSTPPFSMSMGRPHKADMLPAGTAHGGHMPSACGNPTTQTRAQRTQHAVNSRAARAALTSQSAPASRPQAWTGGRLPGRRSAAPAPAPAAAPPRPPPCAVRIAGVWQCRTPYDKETN